MIEKTLHDHNPTSLPFYHPSISFKLLTVSIYGLTSKLIFPSPHLADPDGMLAIGGDLTPKRLLLAYQMGIFPWYGKDEPIIWWSPNPRFVLYPKQVKISKSMRQVLRKKQFHITFDTHFKAVIKACQQSIRPGQHGTWITEEMIAAYCELHHLGWAHSVEVWDQEQQLVGGLYGIAIGKCYFGESMFAKKSNASKAGFLVLVQHLTQWGFSLIDCQLHTNHLASLGAVDVSRHLFLQQLQTAIQSPYSNNKWTKRIRS